MCALASVRNSCLDQSNQERQWFVREEKRGWTMKWGLITADGSSFVGRCLLTLIRVWFDQPRHGGRQTIKHGWRAHQNLFMCVISRHSPLSRTDQMQTKTNLHPKGLKPTASLGLMMCKNSVALICCTYCLWKSVHVCTLSVLRPDFTW